MGILDDLAGFGGSFADTYFGIGAKQNTERKAEQGVIENFEKNRASRTKNDFDADVYAAQQAFPEYFDLIAGQEAEKNRAAKAKSAGEAEMLSLHNDPEFRAAFEGLTPGTPEFRSAYAEELAKRGRIPEALTQGDTANTAERKLLASMIITAQSNPELVNMDALRELAQRQNFNLDYLQGGAGGDAMRAGETEESAIDRMLRAGTGDTGRLSRGSSRALIQALDPTNPVFKEDAPAQKNATTILQQYLKNDGTVDVAKIRAAVAQGNNVRDNASRTAATAAKAAGGAGGSGGAGGAGLFDKVTLDKLDTLSPAIAKTIATTYATVIRASIQSGKELPLSFRDKLMLGVMAEKGGVDMNALISGKAGTAATSGARAAPNLFAPATPGAGAVNRSMADLIPNAVLPASPMGGPVVPANAAETPGLTLEDYLNFANDGGAVYGAPMGAQ